MKLGDALGTAIDKRDSTEIGKIVEFCRFNLGMTYWAILEMVQRVRPAMTAAEWDGLLEESDEDA